MFTTQTYQKKSIRCCFSNQLKLTVFYGVCLNGSCLNNFSVCVSKCLKDVEMIFNISLYITSSIVVVYTTKSQTEK